MARNDEGEFELVLGNKQLLSVFFLVVVLLAVFFTAGYLVGRNSMPLVSSSDGAPRNESKPLVVDSAVPVTPPAAPARPTEERAKEPVSTAPQQPPETKSAPEKVSEKAPEKKEPPKAAKETAKSEAKTSKSNPEPSSGQTYLQLSATLKAEADVMVDVLKKRNFPATAVEIPDKPGTFRVLVGPIGDGNLNKTRADLQAAGFPGDKGIPRKF